MQFHLNGFKPGDPLQSQGPENPPDFQRLPDEVDVLIIGAGPAGLLLAAQLARFPNITTRLVESKHGPLQLGQADGLQCRSIEVFEAFGFSERVLKEAYWVNETTFWSPSDDGKGLKRTGRIRDTEEGLSEFPHVILNQARLHDFWLDAIKWSPTKLEPTYSRQLAELKIDAASEEAPVSVTLERTDAAHAAEVEHVRAKYVVGCDGARSAVRRSLGLSLQGDSANQAWGVMDVLSVTDFPDIRLKTAIHSAESGSILIIPREGGYLARLYIELDKLQENERVAAKNVTKEMLVERAQRILQPYKFDVKEVAWWSVYEIGQRLCPRFDDVPDSERGQLQPHVFIAGDACHTHSPKAGQGMNVSMNDAYNLGWKLASVIQGHADPILLDTYSSERQAIAKELIDFDKEFARMFSAKPKSQSKLANGEDDKSGIDPAEFQAYFTKQGRFTAGTETHYKPSMITGADQSYQNLAPGFQIGRRFHSAQVLRLADAKPVHLGHVMAADGRWRIVIFAPKADPTSKSSAVSRLCDYLEKILLPTYTSPKADIDSIIDIRAVFQKLRSSLTLSSLPGLLCPTKGRYGLQDYEKAFTDEESYGFGFGNIFKERGIDRETGCVVVVRPDQYVSTVLPLDGVDKLSEFFAGFMRPARASANGLNGHTA